MRTADAVVQWLVEHDVVVENDNVFVGGDVYIPSGVGPYLSIVESAGGPPIPAHNASSMRQPELQITVRADLLVEAEAMVEAAFTALGGHEQETLSDLQIGDVFFLWMHPSSDIFQLPNDADQRVRLAFNMSFLRR